MDTFWSSWLILQGFVEWIFARSVVSSAYVMNFNDGVLFEMSLM